MRKFILSIANLFLNLFSRLKRFISNSFKTRFKILDYHIPNNPLNIIAVEKRIRLNLFLPVFFPVKLFFYDPNATKSMNLTKENACQQAMNYVREEMAGVIQNLIYDSQSGTKPSQILN